MFGISGFRFFGLGFRLSGFKFETKDGQLISCFKLRSPGFEEWALGFVLT